MDDQEQQEQPGTDIDLGGGEPEEPFVTSDPLAEEGELPPGVEPGSLGGDNPSEDPPEDDEIPEDPDDRDAAPDEEGYPPEAVEEEAESTEAEPEPEVEVRADEEVAVEEQADPPKRKKTQKAPTGQRGYVILRRGEEVGEWVEAFERPDPKSEEPYLLVHRNSNSALRKAYRMLAEQEDEPQEYVLNAIPEKLWRPKAVAGRVHKQTAISIG